MSFSVQRSLDVTREDYYRHYGFADLFASVPQAPLALVEAVRRIPGVEAAAARIVGYGAISIDGFDEPVTGRLVSLPEKNGPPVNGLALRQGRCPRPIVRRRSWSTRALRWPTVLARAAVSP